MLKNGKNREKVNDIWKERREWIREIKFRDHIERQKAKKKQNKKPLILKYF